MAKIIQSFVNNSPQASFSLILVFIKNNSVFATKHLQGWGKTKTAKTEVGEQSPSTAPAKPKTSPTTKPGKPGTKPQKPPSPFKNPNPNENPAPKAKKISPEDAKDEVIDVIIKLLEK